MLEEKLDNKIDELKKYINKEKSIRNSEQQQQIDNELHNIIEKSHSIINALKIYKDELDFSTNYEIMSVYKESLLQLKESLSQLSFDLEMLNKINSGFNQLEAECKRSWVDYYHNITDSKLGTLDIIKPTNPVKVNKSISELKNLMYWTSDIDKIKKFSEEYSKADKIIDTLNMDDEIVSFLKKLNSGNASLFDINDKVLSWIKAERLESKVKLSI